MSERDPHQPHFDDATRTWSEPELVQTARGLWPASGLERAVHPHENENEWGSAVEYRLGDEVVHRSVRVHVKRGLEMTGVAAPIA